MVSLDEDGVASYTFHFDDTANFGWQVDDLPSWTEDDWLHIASLSCVVSPGAEVLLEWMRGVRLRGVVRHQRAPDGDRPTRTTYWGKVQPWLRVLGQRGGIVKASDADIAFLAQAPAVQAATPGISDPVELAASWVEQYGLALGVITLGPGGGAAVEPGGGTTRVPGYPDHSDRHGRGWRHLHGGVSRRADQPGPDLESSLRRAAAAASIICSRQGAQPPTSAEVDELIATAADD